ncbi:MAG: helix-turn-helix transcriptional regulator [Terrimicrobiaceae bacterium]|nr:helix-turn-helix transcriptional regulator [Terrimicrobiaceae bacterium]
MNRVAKGGAEFPAGATIDAFTEGYDQFHEVAAFWKLDLMQIREGVHRGRVRAAHTKGMQLALVEHRCGTRMRGLVPTGTFVLCFPASVEGEVRFRGEPLGAGQIAVQRADNEIDFLFHTAIDMFTVAIDESYLADRAAALWQCDPDLSSRILTAPGHGVDERLRAALIRRLSGGLSEPAALSDPGQGQKLEREIVEGILGGVGEPRPVENSLARRWLARRAAAFLEERFAEDLSISDICRAVRASRRTLHLGFLEVYGLSPMRYLNVVRLNAARRDLMARPDRVSVTQVAGDCGFTHMGRFSSAYRKFFGVLPSREPTSDRD